MAEEDEKRLGEARFRLFNGLPMNTGHAAALAGVCTKTVGNWIRSGKIKGTMTPGGHWLIPASEVVRVITGDLAALRPAAEPHRGPERAAPDRAADRQQAQRGADGRVHLHGRAASGQAALGARRGPGHLEGVPP